MLNTVTIAKGSLQEKQKHALLYRKGWETIWWSNYASLICLLEILIVLWSSCFSYNWFSDYSISFHVHAFSAQGCLCSVRQRKVIWIKPTADWYILKKTLLWYITSFFKDPACISKRCGWVRHICTHTYHHTPKPKYKGRQVFWWGYINVNKRGK